MSSRHIRGNLVYKGVLEKTSSGDVAAADLANMSLILINKDSGAATGITLPAAGYVGQSWIIADAKGDAATNNITITPASGNINGSSTYVIDENYGVIQLLWDGTNYTAFGGVGSIGVAEAGFLDGVTAGTGAASKALVLNSSGDVTIPSGGIIALDRAALAAAGSTASDAAVIASQVVVVTGADGAKGVALPGANTADGPYLVINDAAAALLVYPVSGGNDNINGLAEDAAFTMAGGEWALFVPTSGTQWYTATRTALGKPSPMTRATVANSATISAANLRGRILYQDASGGNVGMTTRTGTQIAGDFPEMRTGDALVFYVASNHASNTSTITAGTDVTAVGSMAVINTGGTFALVKTAATTFDLVRIG